MISPEHKKLLEDLNKTPYGGALKAFLFEELTIIKDVRNAKSWDEAVGNQRATAIIEKLFDFLEERKSVTPKKNSYE